MDDKEIEVMINKLRNIKSEVGDVFEDNNLNLGEVMSLLMSMLVEVALESGMSPAVLINGVSGACVAWEKENEESIEEQSKGTENLQWLN
jgi:hypothetical protein